MTKHPNSRLERRRALERFDEREDKIKAERAKRQRRRFLEEAKDRETQDALRKFVAHSGEDYFD